MSVSEIVDQAWVVLKKKSDQDDNRVENGGDGRIIQDTEKEQNLRDGF